MQPVLSTSGESLPTRRSQKQQPLPLQRLALQLWMSGGLYQMCQPPQQPPLLRLLVPLNLTRPLRLSPSQPASLPPQPNLLLLLLLILQQLQQMSGESRETLLFPMRHRSHQLRMLLLPKTGGPLLPRKLPMRNLQSRLPRLPT